MARKNASILNSPMSSAQLLGVAVILFIIAAIIWTTYSAKQQTRTTPRAFNPQAAIPAPVCGNGLCEQGEYDRYEPAGCDVRTDPTCTDPGTIIAGSCPQDCETVRLPSEQEACASTGGRWVSFKDSCTNDNCGSEYTDKSNQSCLQVLTEGCDCGVDMCWSGTGCVANPPQTPPNYQTSTPVPANPRFPGFGN